MAGKIKIVTDSTSDISPAFARELGVDVVPLNVSFGARSFKDRVDLDSEGFFRLLQESDDPPSTSLPSPGDFLKTYERLLGEYETIISIHISFRLSGTYQSACAAAANLSGSDIIAIDSGMVASALMLIVVRAARAAGGGLDRDALAASVRQDLERAGIYFVVDTLDYLQRGGRIGKSGHLVGSMLNIKPILTVVDGAIETAAKVRSAKKALKKAIEFIIERGPAPEIAAVGHADSPAEADRAADMLGEAFPGLEIVRSEIGPVIGTHSGPGCIEISFI